MLKKNIRAGSLRTHSALTRMGSKLRIDNFDTVLNDETYEIERDLYAFGPIGMNAPALIK